MESKSLIRAIVAGLIGLALVILVLILLVRAFSGGGAPKSLVKPIDLGSYQNTAATVTLLVDSSPTQVDQDHHQVRITVSQTENRIDVMEGYQGTVVDSRNYPNNEQAFGVFLQSLKLMNFAKGNSEKALADYRGYCPFGDRYILTFNDGTTDKFNWWTTSCSASQGTYQGDRNSTLRLIRYQIPTEDYNQLTSSVMMGF